MDEQEKEEILYRLDERTERVDGYLKRLDRRVSENETILGKHNNRITDNENMLNTFGSAIRGLGATVLALISGIGAKLAGILHI